MVRQPRESAPTQSELDSTAEGVEGSAGSRRTFLQLSALGAVGLAACSTTPGDDTGTGGTGATTGGTGAGAGKGGTGTGGSATGGTGTGGSATGGTGTGGTGTGGAATGGTGTGGTSTGGSATGGTGTGGTGTGGTGQAGQGMSTGGSQATGGAPNGGSPATGGAPNGGMGGSPTAGGGGTGGGCTPPCMGWKEANSGPVSTLPDGTHGPSQKMVPSPFKFIDGTTISSKADWERLRADLVAMLEAAVYGPKMPPPDTLKATISGTTVTVNCTVGTKTGSFTFTIKGGGSGGMKKPGVIRCAQGGNPFPSTVATIDFDEHSIAAEDKKWPTTGLVTTLYGNTAAKSGSDICWAWGASRVIDALEQLGPDATGIDTHALATTGCSFAGKGGFAMGAFDERVVLVCPEEAGSGGAALWRVSSAEAAKGQNIQEATEIVGEQNWEGKDFHDLFSGKSKTSAPVDMLIADQHFLVAICAPRACLIIDNDIDWLGPLATYAGGVIGKKVYQALGIADRCEVSVAPNHTHCSFPSSQQADLTAFINRFLLKQAGATTPAKDVLNATNSKIKTYNDSDWIDWTTPTLSGDLVWDPFA